MKNVEMSHESALRHARVLGFAVAVVGICVLALFGSALSPASLMMRIVQIIAHLAVIMCMTVAGVAIVAGVSWIIMPHRALAMVKWLRD